MAPRTPGNSSSASTRKGRAVADIVVPAGAPDWITADLIADTLDTWQPHFPEALTVDDALEILLDAARLIDFLESEP